MANIKSSKKSIRKIAKLTARNKAEKSRIKTASKKLQVLKDAGDSEVIKAAAKDLMSVVDKAGKHGVWHKNKVNRIKSRLTPLIVQSVVEKSDERAASSTTGTTETAAADVNVGVSVEKPIAKKKTIAKKSTAKKASTKKATATKMGKSTSKKSSE